MLLLVALVIAAYALHVASQLKKRVGTLEDETHYLRRWLRKLSAEHLESVENPAAAVESEERASEELPPPTPQTSQLLAGAATVRSRLSEESRPAHPEGHGSKSTASPPPATTLDFETLIGSTWLLRAGLGILAIALALFARSVAPQLSAEAKVALAYAGSLAFFGVGKYFETKLDKFARPVMAAGLSFGFFVAFAAHFVPAMQAVSMPVSIAWMVVSMATVLIAADRWKSEPTAIVAIVLGHISAQVTAGQADMYSLVMIGALALTAMLLLLRHGWISLGLVGVGVSYGAHLLWLLTDRQLLQGDQAFWLNLAFLTSYYVIYLVADILWWHRREDRPAELHDEDVESIGVRRARVLGPANLIAYVSLTTFVYFVSGAAIESIEWYFLTLGTVQAVLAWLYWGFSHEDFAFYPAIGTVLWTLGMFAALDALALNLVLSGQAVLLLFVAHRTGLSIFRVLAQVMMAVAFVHYAAFPRTAETSLQLFVGGLGVSLVYLVKAMLEEVWYPAGETPDTEEFAPTEAQETPPERVSSWAERFSIPSSVLAPAYAIICAGVLVREGLEFFGSAQTFVLYMIGTLLVILTVSIVRASPILLFTVSTLAVAGMGFVPGTPSLPAFELLAAIVVCAIVLSVRYRAFGEDSEGLVMTHSQGIAWVALVGAFLALGTVPTTLANYLLWMALPLMLLVFQHRATRQLGRWDKSEGDAESTGVDPGWISALTAVGIGTYVFALTTLGVEPMNMSLVWIAAWGSAAMVANRQGSIPTAFVAGYTVLIVGYVASILSSGTPIELGSWGIGGFVTLVPIALAIELETHRDEYLRSDELALPAPMVLAAAFMAYLVGLGMLSLFAREQLPFGWSFLALGFSGLLFMGWASPGRTPGGIIAIVAAALAWHGVLLTGLASPSFEAALIPILLFSIATIALERRVRSMWGPGAGRVAQTTALSSLLVLSTLSAMAAVYHSAIVGATWTTAGWSVLGGSMMGAGFALKSAIHRRIALVLLALCIVRVFFVDTVGLSDTARIGAFFVLGLILVGIALLYSKYTEELKS